MEAIQLDPQQRAFLRGVPYQQTHRLSDPTAVSLVDLENWMLPLRGDKVVVIYRDAVLYNSHHNMGLLPNDRRSRFGLNELGHLWAATPASAIQALKILTRLHRDDDDQQPVRIERHNLPLDGMLTSHDLQQIHRQLGDGRLLTWSNFRFHLHQVLPLARMEEDAPPIYLHINGSFPRQSVVQLTDAIVFRHCHPNNQNQNNKPNNQFGKLRYTGGGRLFSNRAVEMLMQWRSSMVLEDLYLIDIPESQVDMRLFECSESIHRLVVDFEPDAPGFALWNTPSLPRAPPHPAPHHFEHGSNNDNNNNNDIEDQRQLVLERSNNLSDFPICTAAARAMRQGVSPRCLRVIDNTEQMACHGEHLLVEALATPGASRVHEICVNPSVLPNDCLVRALRANTSLRNLVFSHGSLDELLDVPELTRALVHHPTLETITLQHVHWFAPSDRNRNRIQNQNANDDNDLSGADVLLPVLRANHRLQVVVESGDPEGIQQWQVQLEPTLRRNRWVRNLIDGRVRLSNLKLFDRAVWQRRGDPELLALLLQCHLACLVQRVGGADQATAPEEPPQQSAVLSSLLEPETKKQKRDV